MKRVFHARYTTSDFDEGSGPGQLFDTDARCGAARAYLQALRHIRRLAKLNKGPHWKDVRSTLRPALIRISRNYWRDFDHDERKNSANVKAEATKLLKPLKATVAALDKRPFYVRRALNTEAAFSAESSTSEYGDVYKTAQAVNQALAQACEVFVKRGHRKSGEAIRFRNASREIAALWTEVFGKKFPLNTKTGRAKDSEIAKGVSRIFVSPGPVFVYLILYEIGNRWVTVSQVEEALKTLKGGK